MRLVKKKRGRPVETFIDDQLVATIRVISSLMNAPVPTSTLSDCLCRNDAYLRKRLIALEQRGIVSRISERSGWTLSK